MNPLRLGALLTAAATITALGSAPASATSEPGYQGFLGHTRIDNGGSKHTDAFKNDNRLMRACGSSEGHIECTGWF